MTDVRSPRHWIIKIWTTGAYQLKHPKNFDTFQEASTAKAVLDKQLAMDTTIRLYDEDKLLDLTVNANQVVTMKVAAVYEHGDEDDRDYRPVRRESTGRA